MLIRRGGRTAKTWEQTDTIPPSDLTKQWVTDGRIVVDATIDKLGQRHTDVCIEMDDDDIAELAITFIDRSRDVHRRLDRAEEALRKIDNLVAQHAHAAPSPDALNEAVLKVCDWAQALDSDEPDLAFVDWARL